MAGPTTIGEPRWKRGRGGLPTNQVILEGAAGCDAVYYADSGKIPVTKFTMAHRWRRGGHPTWVSVSAFKDLAAPAGAVTKGDRIRIEGFLRTELGKPYSCGQRHDGLSVVAKAITIMPRKKREPDPPPIG